MTLAAEVSRMIADHELRRLGLRPIEQGLSRDTLAASYLPLAERIVVQVLRWQDNSGPMLATLADAARRVG